MEIRDEKTLLRMHKIKEYLQKQNKIKKNGLNANNLLDDPLKLYTPSERQL